ncbi:MAG: HAMP domain-containing histidine kinase [Fibrobacterales bacterium]|nr:HAMP domain-containing histidine kinase [Fibrobacterales bacterium]
MKAAVLRLCATARLFAGSARAKSRQLAKYLQPTNPKALGAYFSVIFFVVAVAVVLLMTRTVAQIRSEASLALRQRGELTVQVLNQKLADVLAKENNRSFSQYRYYMTVPSLSGEETVLSPLADYPVRGDIPGMIGYFQIDPDRSFHSPMLPEDPAKRRQLASYPERVALLNRLESIVKNRDLGERKVVERVAVRDLMPEYGDSASAAAAPAEAPEDEIQTISPQPRVVSSTRKQGQTFADPARTRSEETFTDVEIYPFEATVSGRYIVFHRDVLRGDKRHVQGFIVGTQAFFISLFQSDIRLGELGLRLLHGNSRIFETGSWDRPNGETVRYAMAWPFQEIRLEAMFLRPQRGSATVAIAILASLFLLGIALAFVLIYRVILANLQIARKHSDFVSAISHELKTPLAAIRQSGEILENGWLPSEEKRMRHYHIIVSEAQRLSGLIQNVLDLSKLERNQWAAEMRPREINSLVREFANTFSSTIADRGFRLELDLCETDRTHLLDRDSLMQVLVNVTDNAVKFSKNSDVKVVQIYTAPEDGGTLLGVRDYGPGVPENEIDKIFATFYRIENELTRDTHGTGIGLSLVKNICDKMKIRIEVRNAEPGFDFRLHVPEIRTAEEEAGDSGSRDAR